MFRNILVTIVALILSSVVQAKTVIVVLDDSGSIVGQYPYAKFELQLLVSMLDPIEDELIIFKTSESDADGWNARLNNQQRAINKIKYWSAGGDTPWRTVDMALDFLDSRQNEETFLFVITDGQFHDVPRLRALEKRLSQIMSRRQAATAAAWMVIGTRDENESARRIFLKAFNDDENEGYLLSTAKDARLIDNFQELLMQIIGRGKAPFSDFTLRGSTLTIKPKFPLTKIQLINVSDLGGDTFDILNKPDDTYVVKRFSSEMHDEVNFFNLPGDKVYGTTIELDKTDAIPANQALQIDLKQAPKKEEIVIVPHLGFTLELTLYDDSKGHGLIPLKQGEEVIADHPYYAVARLRDSQGQPLPESMLKDMQFWLSPKYDIPGSSEDEFKFNTTMQHMVRMIYFETPGTHTVNVTVYAPGYLIKESNSFTVTSKEDPFIEGKWLLNPLCDGCTADSIDTNPGINEILADLKWEPSLPERLKAELDINLPDGIELQYTDKNNKKISLSAGYVNARQINHIELVASNKQQEFIDFPAFIELTPLPPFSGSLKKELVISSTSPALSIKYINHTLGPSVEKFALPTDQFGDHSLLFQFEGLSNEFNPDYLSIDDGGAGLKFDIEYSPASGNLLVTPDAWLCDCILSPGEFKITVLYKDKTSLQQASESNEITLLPSDFLRRCAQELFLLILLILFLLFLRRWFQTNRFHRHLAIKKYAVTPAGEADEYDVVLHRWWSHFTLLNERNSIEGLELLATESASKVEITTASAGDLMFNGRPLVEWFEDNQPVYMMVNDIVGSQIRMGDVFYRLERID